MKIDLDDIQRKALACRAASVEPWVTLDASGRMPEYCDGFAVVRTDVGEQIADAYDNTPWGDRQCLDHAAHIAANSPPVTLALIARIRELENALRSVASDGKQIIGALGAVRVEEILEKGVVIGE